MLRRHLSGGAALAAALLVVLAIAWLRQGVWLPGVDHEIMVGAGRGRAAIGIEGFTGLMLGVSLIGEGWARSLVALVFAAWLYSRDRSGAAIWLLLTVFGGVLLNSGLKQLFKAPRPDLLPHLDVVASYSFPSGHAAGATILCGAIALLAGRRSVWAGAVALTFLIVVSRVWLGVHWPSDVLAGVVEGAGFLAFCNGWRPRTRSAAMGAS